MYYIKLILNEMVKICNKYGFENNDIVNSKKTICVKLGSTIIDGESTFLTATRLSGRKQYAI